MMNPADEIHQKAVATLIPYARNSRTHSSEQVSQLAASIREWGWTIPVLIDEDGMIIAGHGRVLAAQKLKMETVPVVIAKGWTDAQKRAYVVADNKLALNAGWDNEILENELRELQDAGINLGSVGFSDAEFAKLTGSDVMYTRKITAPIYEPKLKQAPPITDLYDDQKTQALISEIERHELPDDLRMFLFMAAHRHTQFSFKTVAEFYCHQTDEVKALMRKSALIIIDFDEAIEHGYIRLTKAVAKQYEADYPDAI